MLAFVLSCAAYVLRLIPTPLGFSYQGISVFFLTVTLNVPVILLGKILMCRDDIMNGRFVKGLKFAASLTSGMYYMHMTFIVWLLGMSYSFALVVLIFVCCAILTAFMRRFRWLCWLVA